MKPRQSSGSNWRKWDLHVHAPGTKKNDQYKSKDSDPMEKFCQMLEESDVSAFGICDYFSVGTHFSVIKKYNEMYPKSEKSFFPNIEICTSESVNVDHEEINVHLIFNPKIEPDLELLERKLNEFLSKLKTNLTQTKTEKPLYASELTSTEHYEKATTTRQNIDSALRETFGQKAILEDIVIKAVAANNDGIRTATEIKGKQVRGKKRKASITDEFDKFANVFFGSKDNIEYYADTDRLETDELILAKPVISGSDAHSFDDLNNHLGRRVLNNEGNIVKDITWIKADQTYEGLKQIIYEPIGSNRVHVGETRPDIKSPDRVIRSIKFIGTDQFPAEIEFNENLCSIIGSRSSGKSALLAYLAYGVDKEKAMEMKEDGPAINIHWEDVSMGIEVEWGDGIKQDGKIVYIPQNHLYKLSQNPDLITQMIEPVLYGRYQSLKSTRVKLDSELEKLRKSISSNTREWFRTMKRVDRIQNDMKSIGNKQTIQTLANTQSRKTKKLQKLASLSQNEIDKYADLTSKFGEFEDTIEEFEGHIQALGDLVEINKSTGKIDVVEFTVNIVLDPSIDDLPEELKSSIEEKLQKKESTITKSVRSAVAGYYAEQQKKVSDFKRKYALLQKKNARLIEKCKKHEILEEQVRTLEEQKKKLLNLKRLESERSKAIDQLRVFVSKIKEKLEDRDKEIQQFVAALKEFNQSEHTIEFKIEAALNRKSIEQLSERFNKKENKPFIDSESLLDVLKLRRDPEEFLNALHKGSQKLIQHENMESCAEDALSLVEEILYSAKMEGDVIGGFEQSTMTEGKQALFALTLLLAEESESWPLLIDQPEDDLDSRSTYDAIVPYLKQQKKIRQILMVSHNANLVIGADSEQIVVANKHAEDRKNRDGQLFAYRSGAIENSEVINKKQSIVLESRGIREHACEILDGGVAAFEKRQHKYNIR